MINENGKILVAAGAILFLLGLVQGLVISKVRNPRMALSGHLSALQSGMALMIFGIIWNILELAASWSEVAVLSSIVGYYLIWIGITLASITGASKALPISGQGFSAGKIQERLVTGIEVIGVLMALVSGTLIVWGLV
jgi:(hydroxyamino)benzene mutase